MIQSYVSEPIVLASNTDSVRFQRDCIRTCGCNRWLCHNQGSANYDVVDGGIYIVDFHGSVSSAAAGVVALAVFLNGEELPGTRMVTTLTAAGDYANIGMEKAFRVCCKGNGNISIRSVGAVPTPTDVTTPIVTQTPIITSGNFILDRKS